jgi:hypothetical protein
LVKFMAIWHLVFILVYFSVLVCYANKNMAM